MPSYRIALNYTDIVEGADAKSALEAIAEYVRAQDTFDGETARSIFLAGRVHPPAGEIEVVGESPPWELVETPGF